MEEVYIIYLEQRIRRFALATTIFGSFLASLIALATQTYIGLTIFIALLFAIIFFMIPRADKQIKIERMIKDSIIAKKSIKQIEW